MPVSKLKRRISDYSGERMHTITSVNAGSTVRLGGVVGGVNGNERADWAELYKSLRMIKNDGWKETVTWMNATLKSVPYEIPPMYALEQEKKALGEMSGRLNLLKGALCQTDMDAVSSDWKKIGTDMKGAIGAYRGGAAGKGQR